MNFVFISPHFPETYYLFCRALKAVGVNVLGITDTPTDFLTEPLKSSLTDHYMVHDLQNVEEKAAAVSWFKDRYGPIDYIESNNEFWLDDDARLREIFGVKTGPWPADVLSFNRKSLMKDRYRAAGVKTARWRLASSLADAEEFVAEVGYPLVLKPDHGVGAMSTYKITDRTGLVSFFSNYDGRNPYIMEEYVDGELLSLDGVCDSKSQIVYPTHHVFPTPIMEIVNGLRDVCYYTSKDIPDDLLAAAQRTLTAFKARSRFFHLEFFRLRSDKEGLGMKGDIIGLEVNMRVPGGYTPDMIDYAYSVDIYRIWADVIAYDRNLEETDKPRAYCLYIGRRDGVSYRRSEEELRNRYGHLIMQSGRMPDILSEAMGNRYFMFRVFDFDTLLSIWTFALERI